ncbi:MAG: hypothetical protein R3C03_16425 [Pirellulaceae bacterium]
MTPSIDVSQLKDIFYRNLVQEYRREFGNEDYHVAQALNLLAGCLLDQNKRNEAESVLRESLLLANESDKLVAQRLLDIVNGR